MYLHVLSRAIKGPEVQAEAWRVYISAMNRVTQHLVRLVTPTGVVHERVIFDVPENAISTVEERILPVLLGASADVQRKAFGVSMQPSWNARALISPSILAQPLDLRILADSSACISLQWSQLRCNGLLAFQAGDAVLLERIADAGWEIKQLPPPLVPLATTLWKIVPPRSTTVLPLIATSQDTALPSIAARTFAEQNVVTTPPADSPATPAEAPVAVSAVLPPADPIPAAQAPEPLVPTVGDDRVLAQGQDVGLLLGVSELGAAVRLAWRAMSLGVTGPQKQVAFLIRTLLERALDWGQKDGCGILGVIPPSIADDITNEPWLGRVRFLDGRDLHQSAAIPLSALHADRRDAIFQRYGLPTNAVLPVGMELADVLYQSAPHLATPTLVGLIAPPGDDLRGVVDSNGAVLLVGELDQETALLADLLWSLFDTPAFERTPLIVSRGALQPPASLAERSFQLIIEPAYPTTIRLNWEGNRWELLDSAGQRLAVVEADLHARPAEAVAQESDAIHRILGAGYGNAPSLVPQAASEPVVEWLAPVTPAAGDINPAVGPAFATYEPVPPSANGNGAHGSDKENGLNLGGLLSTLYALPGSPERNPDDEAPGDTQAPSVPEAAAPMVRDDEAGGNQAWDLNSLALHLGDDEEVAAPVSTFQTNDDDLSTLFGMPEGETGDESDDEIEFPFGDAFDLIDEGVAPGTSGGTSDGHADNGLREALMTTDDQDRPRRPWQRKQVDANQKRRFSVDSDVPVEPIAEPAAPPALPSVEETAQVEPRRTLPPLHRSGGRTRFGANRSGGQESAPAVVSSVPPPAAAPGPSKPEQEEVVVELPPSAPAEGRRAVVGRSRGRGRMASRPDQQQPVVQAHDYPVDADPQVVATLEEFPTGWDGASEENESEALANGAAPSPGHMQLSSFALPVIPQPISFLLGDDHNSPLVVAGLAERVAMESQRLGDLVGAMQCRALGEQAQKYALVGSLELPALVAVADPFPMEETPVQEAPLVNGHPDDDDDFADAGFVIPGASTGATTWHHEADADLAQPKRSRFPKRRAGAKVSNGRG